MANPSPFLQRNNYLAGLGVVVGLILLLGVLIVISYRRGHPSGVQHFGVTFPIDIGVQGLEPGMPVLYGGLQVGHVDHLQLKSSEIIVHVTIARNVKLHPGVIIRRASALVGGGSSLVIANLGDLGVNPFDNNAHFTATAPIEATTSLLGKKNAGSIARIKNSVAMAIPALEALREKAERIGSAAEKMQKLRDNIELDLVVWRARWEILTKNTATWSKDIEAMQKSFQHVNAATVRVKNDIDALKELFDGPKWDALQQSLDEVEKEAELLNESFEHITRPRLDKLLAAAETNWARLPAIENELRAMAKDATASIALFKAKATLAAGQLVQIKAELIAALGLPLLKRPTQETLQLFERLSALETWARSAEQLRLLLDLVASIPSGQDEVTLARLLDTLRAALADFENAQSKMPVIAP